MTDANIKRLLHLAAIASKEDLLDMELMEHFNFLRENLGLAHLLLTIQDYVEAQSKLTAQIPETSKPNEKSNPLQ
jgi:hypothetical protein